MTVLLIASYEPCGKTALCAGIGKSLINAGRSVGYVKPIEMSRAAHAEGCDSGAFLNQALELGESEAQLCAFTLTQEELWRSLSEDVESFSRKIKAACDSAGTGKDVLIVESPGSLKADQVSALACYTIAEKLAAKVVFLLCYSTGFKSPEIEQVLTMLRDRLAGIVLNQVPANKVGMLKAECEAHFQARGMKVLGVLPESRPLLGVTVSEIAAALHGEIVSSTEKANELVENVMLSAMTPDSARGYYERKANKAVVARGERPDMLLAALDTSTKCLIVTGQKPSAPVIVKAEDKKVPLVVVSKDVNEVVAGIEQALAMARFQQQRKLAAFTSMLDEGFDFKTLNAALGI